MPECAFCGQRLKPGTGSLFVKKDGTPFFFCSRKCEKNLLFKRKPASTKWTETHRLAKEASRPEKKVKQEAAPVKEKEVKKKGKKKRRVRRKRKKG